MQWESEHKPGSSMVPALQSSRGNGAKQSAGRLPSMTTCQRGTCAAGDCSAGGAYHWGTGEMAPPGADSTTPTWPSDVGPRLDQAYCMPCAAAPDMLHVMARGLTASSPCLTCAQRWSK